MTVIHCHCEPDVQGEAISYSVTKERLLRVGNHPRNDSVWLNDKLSRWADLVIVPNHELSGWSDYERLGVYSSESSLPLAALRFLFKEKVAHPPRLRFSDISPTFKLIKDSLLRLPMKIGD